MQQFKITAPDGAVYNVTAPDGATEQEALAKVKAQAGNNQQSSAIPKPQKTEPLGPVLWDQFKKGAASLAGLPGLAMDLAQLPGTMIGNAIYGPAQSPPILGNTQRFAGAAESALGVKNLPVPKNEYGKPSKSNEYLAKIANFAGSAVLPGIGVVSAAERKLLAAIVEVASTALSATSAVEGKELGATLAKKFGVDQERGEAIGEILGSLAGPGTVAGVAVGIEKAANKTGQVITNKTGLTGLSKEAQEQAGKSLAVKELREGLDANLATPANLKAAQDLQQQIPGFQPTLGQASGAPGVIAIEKRIAGMSPNSLAKAAERDAVNTKAMAKFAGEKFPSGKIEPVAPVKNLYQGMAREQQKKLDTVEAEIANLSAKYGDRTDVSAVGERLRTLRAEAEVSARAVKNAKYSDVYETANRAGIKEDISDIQALIKDVAGSDANAAQVMPQTYAAMRDVVNKYSPPAKQPTASAQTLSKLPGLDRGGLDVSPKQIDVPFEALHSMKRRSSADLSAALSAGDGQKAYFIKQVDDALKAKLAKFEGDAFGEVSKKLRDANAANAKYAQTFREGLGGRMGPMAKTKYGEITQDSDIVKKLVFNPENKRGVQEFFDIFGNSPEAHSMLRNGVVDMFASSVVRDGQIKPGLVETFMRQHKAQLDMLPSLRSELMGVDKINDTLLARQATIQAQKALLDKTVVGKIAKMDNPSDAIAKALDDPQYMRALTSQAYKSKDAAQALASSIAREIVKKDAPFQYLLANEDRLRSALAPLGKQHFDNLKKLLSAQEVTDRVRPPTHVELDKIQDIGEQTVGTSVKGIFSRIRNAKQGFQSAEYVALDLGGRYLYKIKTAEMNKLLEAAIYDPAVAKMWLDLPKQTPKQAFNNLRNHAYAHGVRVTGISSQDNPDEDALVVTPRDR